MFLLGCTACTQTSPQVLMVSIKTLVLVAGHLRRRRKGCAVIQPSGQGLPVLQGNETNGSSASAGTALRAPAGAPAVPTPRLAQSRARHRARRQLSGAGCRSLLRAGGGSGSLLKAGLGSGSCHMAGRGGGSHHMAGTGAVPLRAGGGSTSAGGRRQGVRLQLLCSRGWKCCKLQLGPARAVD